MLSKDTSHTTVSSDLAREPEPLPTAARHPRPTLSIERACSNGLRLQEHAAHVER
jgi:hypothetical protein